MMTLSPEELSQVKTLKASGLQTDEVFNQLAASRTGMKQASSFAGSFGRQGPSETQQDIAEIATKGFAGSFDRFTQNLKGAATQEGITMPQRIVGGALTVPTLGLDLAGDVAMGVGKAAISQETEEGIQEFVGKGVSQAMQTDFAQKTMGWYDTLTPQEQYNVSQIFMPTAELVGEVGTGGIFGKLLQRGKQAVPDRTMVESAIQNAAQEAGKGNISPATRIVNATIPEAERTAAVDALSQNFIDSLVENRASINNKLERLADENSRGDVTMARDDLVRSIANEGYVPIPEGRLAKFTDSMTDVKNRQSELMGEMQKVLAETRETVDIADFYDEVRTALRNDPRVGSDINSALRRVDSLEDGSRTKYGDVLNADNINSLKIEGNQKRADVGRQGSDPIITDVWSNLARTSNNWLNTNVGDDLFKRTNAEWARLQVLNETMDILNNQQIDVGLLGRALGSYVTTVAGSTAGLSVGGPGGLVIAGLIAKIGGDKFADMMRKKMFNPETTKAIREVMRNDDELRLELLETAKTKEAQNIINDMSRLLPEGRTDVPQSQVFTPIEAPEAGVRGAGTPVETAKPGAVKTPEGTAKETEVARAIREDTDAVEQAVAEMEADLTGETRVSTGENKIQNVDGGYYRFKELPSWVPDGFRDSDLMARVMENITNGKRPRSNAALEIELQEIVEKRIATRVQELKKGRGDKGVFSGDTAFAAALMAGGTYLMADESGMLPVVAIGSMMANPVSRKAVLKNAQRLAETGKKLPEAYKRKIADELEAYDGGFMDVKEGGATKSIAPDEVDARLVELQERNYSGKFTNKDALEAEELLANKGVILEPDSFKPGATQSTNLLEENYAYHATNPKNIDKIREEGLKTGGYGSLYFAPSEEGISGYGGRSPAKLRIKRENLPEDFIEAYGERGASDLGEIKTKQSVPPEALEVFEDGKWQPLVKNGLLEEAKKYSVYRSETPSSMEGKHLGNAKTDGKFYFQEGNFDDLFMAGKIDDARQFTKQEISFKNPKIVDNAQMGKMEDPSVALWNEWFGDKPVPYSKKEDRLLRDRMVAEEALRRGYDGIVYGTREIQDLSDIKPKTFTDFSKLYGKPIYHGSDKEIGTFLPSNSGRKDYGGGAYFYADKADTKRFGKVTNEVFVSPTAKIDEFTSAEWRELEKQLSQQWGDYKDEYKKFGDFVTFFFRENGVDGIRVSGGKGSDLTVVYNPDAIKTRTQLEDIWKKANGKPQQKRK